MTDELIIKNFRNGVYKNKPMLFGQKFLESVLDLINRQKAEKERLEDENYTLKNKIEIRDNLIEQLGSDIDVKYNTIYTMREKLKNSKSEAIKEFAERLKRTSVGLEIGDDKKLKMTVVSTVAIDNLVKEMTEER